MSRFFSEIYHFIKRNTSQLHSTKKEKTSTKIVNFMNNPSKKAIIIDYNRLK